VVISAGQLIAAREAQKADARPGAFIATGDHGGIVGTAFEPGDPHLTYLPIYRHTWCSDVRTSVLPSQVTGVRGEGDRAVPVPVRVKDEAGRLLGDAIPSVGFYKQARFRRSDMGAAPDEEVEILAQIQDNLARHPLAGIVVEGTSPHGKTGQTAQAALRRAIYLGMPVVSVGRGNPGGFVTKDRLRLGIGGQNLTATKARLLLMAAILKLGMLPPAADPDHPTPDEVAATSTALAAYQAIFDTH
jgi:hypothetical protein